MRRKINWPLLLAVFAGLIVFGACTFFLLRYASTHQITARVPVPNKDIPAYTEITAKDLEWRVIPAGGFEPGAARTPEEIVGRIALAPLFRGEQVRLERLVDKAAFDATKRVLAVNVDLTRSGGNNIRPGDLVDVVWLQSEQVPAAVIATDARVLSIQDAQGRPVTGEAPSVPGQSPLLPAVVGLAVKPEEVAMVSRGAWKDSKNIVLVKKFQPGGTFVFPPQQASGAGEGGGAGNAPVRQERAR